MYWILVLLLDAILLYFSMEFLRWLTTCRSFGGCMKNFSFLSNDLLRDSGKNHNAITANDL